MCENSLIDMTKVIFEGALCVHFCLLLNQAPHIGWRTEFRSMEVQLTDFENAAFTVFVALITRVVLAFDLAFYIPISKVVQMYSK